MADRHPGGEPAPRRAGDASPDPARAAPAAGPRRRRVRHTAQDGDARAGSGDARAAATTKAAAVDADFGDALASATTQPAAPGRGSGDALAGAGKKPVARRAARAHRGTSPDVAFETLDLEANGLHFHALAAGPADGPLVLLLHGFPETAWSWRRQVAALAAEGLRVVAPDQRGYGLSDKPADIRAYAIGTLAQDVVGMARALGRSRFSVVGHDWGGAVAWFLAAHRQDVCSRAAILNAPHPAAFASALRRHPGQLGRSAYMALFQVPGLPEWLLAAGDFRLLERSLRRTSREDAFTPEDIEALRAAWRRPGALTGMLAWYRALRYAPHDDAHAAGGAHPRIEIPVRVLWGDRDAFLEPALAQASITQCAHGEVFHLPTATHWLHHEEPRRVNALLKAFLQ